MRGDDRRRLAAAIAVIGVTFCVAGALLLGDGGLVGVGGWLLVLFGVASLIQAVMAGLGLYAPRGSDRDDGSA